MKTRNEIKEQLKVEAKELRYIKYTIKDMMRKCDD